MIARPPVLRGYIFQYPSKSQSSQACNLDIEPSRVVIAFLLIFLLIIRDKQISKFNLSFFKTKSYHNDVINNSLF